VPSFVESDDAQQRMIEACGLALEEIRVVKDNELCNTPRSPKLRPGSIVSGYLARKAPEGDLVTTLRTKACYEIRTSMQNGVDPSAQGS